MSASIGQDGRHGGPPLETPLELPKFVYSWRTMPENLRDAGVSWVVPSIINSVKGLKGDPRSEHHDRAGRLRGAISGATQPDACATARHAADTQRRGLGAAFSWRPAIVAP